MHEDRADLTRANLAYIDASKAHVTVKRARLYAPFTCPRVSKHERAIMVSPVPSLLRTRIGEIGTLPIAEVPSECRYGGREGQE